MPVNLKVERMCLVAILEGEIDHHSAQNMREKIDEAVGKMHPKLLKLDFGKVNFMDSSGIGLIMGRYKLMNYLKGDLEVVNIPPKINKIIKLSGLYRLKKR